MHHKSPKLSDTYFFIYYIPLKNETLSRTPYFVRRWRSKPAGRFINILQETFLSEFVLLADFQVFLDR